jgi:hypothetical protein
MKFKVYYIVLAALALKFTPDVNTSTAKPLLTDIHGENHRLISQYIR